METDAELSILESIYSSQRDDARQVTQRELAKHAGLSLGMTNVLLKRFSEKGWVLIRKANARNISYALTPEGIGEIAKRTFGFFRRTARSASIYRELLETFVLARKQAGVSTIVLGGPSDVDFLLEYACERYGVVFMKTADVSRARRISKQGGAYLVLAEGEDRSTSGAEGTSVQDILLHR